MKLFEKPWLEILVIRTSDIVTFSEPGTPDYAEGEGGEYGED